MAPGLSLYRGLTRALGAVVPRFWPSPREESATSADPWRGGFRGASEETARTAGSIWVHAASMGEVSAARGWIEALLARGYRPPFLLTTRTRTGLDRARATWGDRVAARIAPHDFPQTVGAVFEDACPWRLDIIETELWPNLIAEAGERETPVVIVGGTVSERTAARLVWTGVAGRDLLGDNVFVLAQSDRHAARFHRLGAPMERIRVIGDLKASSERPILDPEGAAPPVPFGTRPALVFGSLRPGEERVARLLAETLRAYKRRAAEPPRDRARRVGEPGPAPRGFEGRTRSILVVAPRHRETEGSVRRVLEGAGFEVHVRDESSRNGATLHGWIDSVAGRPGPCAALLATRGELPEAYSHAWGAVVGGTFAPYGGHNVWEPAARACPVLVGPHHGDVETAVESLRAEGAGVAVADEAHLLRTVEGWLADRDLESRGRAARRAATAAAGAVERGMEALDAWELVP